MKIGETFFIKRVLQRRILKGFQCFTPLRCLSSKAKKNKYFNLDCSNPIRAFCETTNALNSKSMSLKVWFILF
jgi:hypothetical protein